MNRDFLKRYIKKLIIHFSIIILVFSLQTPWNSSGWGFSPGRILEGNKSVIYVTIIAVACSSYILVLIDRVSEKREKKKRIGK